MEGAAITLSTIMENVTTLTTGVSSMLSAFSSYWFIYLPLTITVFGFIFGTVKSLLFFKRRRRK